jgi:hypothetical protein
VAWGQGVGRNLPQAAVAFDLDTRERTVVAQSSGEIDPVQVGGPDGRTVVWTEMSTVLTDASAPTWRLYAQALGTDGRWLMAQDDTPTRMDAIPFPQVGDTWAVWTQLERGSATPSLALEGCRLDAHSCHQFGGEVSALTVYSHGPSLYRLAQDARGTDVTVVDTVTGRQTTLTASGQVQNFAAHDGAIAWEEPSSGDPTSEWYRASPTAPVVKVATTHGGNAQPGAGCVVWLDDRGSLLLRTEDTRGAQGPVTVLAGEDLDIAARWTVEGDHIAWATVDGTGSVTVRVATVPACAGAGT